MSDATRVPHLILRARAARFPRRVLCLGWSAEPVPERSGTLFACDRLTGWAGVLLSGRRGAYRTQVSGEEQEPASLAGHLASLTARREPLWVVTPHAARLCSLAGLWRHLDASPEAQVVLSDPPTTLPLRLGSGAGALTLLDTLNHGWLPPPSCIGPAASAAALAQWLASASHTLSDGALGGLCRTAGAQAWHSWRYAHLDTLVECHTHPQVSGMERGAYGPGRCECYRLGEVPGPVYHLDAHALYPHLLATNELPAVLLGYQEDPAPGAAERLLRSHLILAEVDLCVTAPLVPHQDHDGAPVVWPVGAWRGTYCGPELALLLEAGAVRRWRRIAWYRPKPIGRSYAEHMLRLRDDTSLARDVRQWIKLVSNCLPGRWGQSLSRWEDRETALCHAPWDAWVQPDGRGGHERWRSLAWRTQREVRGGWAPEAVPAAAAWVVSLGRTWLWRVMVACGREHVIYCDTDGLMVDRVGHQRLAASGVPLGDGPGALSVRQVYPSVTIHGLRQYVAGGVLTAAGRPLDPPAPSEVAGRVWVCVRAQGHLGRGVEPAPLRHLVPWQTAQQYRHGTAGPGGVVSPLEVGGR